jgi:hypothetical protein
MTSGFRVFQRTTGPYFLTAEREECGKSLRYDGVHQLLWFPAGRDLLKCLL